MSLVQKILENLLSRSYLQGLFDDYRVCILSVSVKIKLLIIIYRRTVLTRKSAVLDEALPSSTAAKTAINKRRTPEQVGNNSKRLRPSPRRKKTDVEILN